MSRGGLQAIQRAEPGVFKALWLSAGRGECTAKADEETAKALTSALGEVVDGMDVKRARHDLARRDPERFGRMRRCRRAPRRAVEAPPEEPEPLAELFPDPAAPAASDPPPALCPDPGASRRLERLLTNLARELCQISRALWAIETRLRGASPSKDEKGD